MRMPSRVLLFLSAIACAAGATARSPATTWGKARVSPRDYAADAAECADVTRYVKASIRPDTLSRIAALSSLQMLTMVHDLVGPDAGISPMAYVAAMDTFRSETDVARRSNTFGAKYVMATTVDVRDALQQVLDACLIEKGYTRMALTDAQVEGLSRLRRHSAARTSYLHAIGSDPTLIEAQKIGFDTAGASASR